MYPAAACDAVSKGLCLEVSYDGFARVVEVHAVGIASEGNAVMRVWQVRGGSVHNEPVGWKLLRLDETRALALANEPSAAPRKGYRRGDSAMQHILCEI